MIGKSCVELVKKYEGCRLQAYKCPAGVWTIGYGHTKDVRQGMQITEDEAERLLVSDLQLFGGDVRKLVKVPISQNQFDALVSFAFNVGSDIDSDTIADGLGDSTLLKKFNAGDVDGAAKEFLKWNKAGGKVLAGLTKRRQAEHDLFLGEV